MAKKRLRPADVHAKIRRAFLVERRWLGSVMIRVYGGLGVVSDSAYRDGLEWFMGYSLEDARCEMLALYDDRPKNEFWWYLTTELLPSREELARRVTPSYVKGGHLPCHVRSAN